MPADCRTENDHVFAERLAMILRGGTTNGSSTAITAQGSCSSLSQKPLTNHGRETLA